MCQENIDLLETHTIKTTYSEVFPNLYLKLYTNITSAHDANSDQTRKQNEESSHTACTNVNWPANIFFFQQPFYVLK